MSSTSSPHLSKSASAEMVTFPSAGSTSLSTFTLQAMKERCLRNQRHIDQLEEEKRQLLRNQQDFKMVLDDNRQLKNKIEELNRLLSNKNVQLETLQMQQKEVCDELQQQQQQQQCNDRKLSAVSHHHSSQHSLDVQSSSLMLMSLQDDEESDDRQNIESDLRRTNDKMEQLKQKLLEQQNILKRLIPLFTRPSTLPEPSAVINNPVEAKCRLCPMCEARFPVSEFNQDEFEGHVMGHFQREDEEESQTLTVDQYDLLADASMMSFNQF